MDTMGINSDAMNDVMNNEEKRYYRVGSISDVAPGSGCVVERDEGDIALFNLNGEYFAISDMCPHRGASLAEGFIDGGKVFCPWHCFDFNLKTGGCEMVPSLRVQTYDVKIVGEDIYIAC
jgi:nitrite reductase (NADH) small subunit